MIDFSFECQSSQKEGRGGGEAGGRGEKVEERLREKELRNKVEERDTNCERTGNITGRREKSNVSIQRTRQ